MTKRDQNIDHFIQRARERFGLELTVRDVEILGKVAKKQIRFHGKILVQPSGRVVMKQRFHGVRACVVFCTIEDCVVTCFPAS